MVLDSRRRSPPRASAAHLAALGSAAAAWRSASRSSSAGVSSVSATCCQAGCTEHWLHVRTCYTEVSRGTPRTRGAEMLLGGNGSWRSRVPLETEFRAAPPWGSGGRTVNLFALLWSADSFEFSRPRLNKRLEVRISRDSEDSVPPHC